jgi:hypothetical protein
MDDIMRIQYLVRVLFTSSVGMIHQGNFVIFSERKQCCSWQPFDADPDTTFYVDADPIPDPDPTLKSTPR